MLRKRGQGRNFNERPRSGGLSLRSWDGGSSRRADRALLRAWKRELRYYDLDPLAWWIHFGEILPSAACCCDCRDFDLGLCLGDSSPICCKTGVWELDTLEVSSDRLGNKEIDENRSPRGLAQLRSRPIGCEKHKRSLRNSNQDLRGSPDLKEGPLETSSGGELREGPRGDLKERAKSFQDGPPRGIR